MVRRFTICWIAFVLLGLARAAPPPRGYFGSSSELIVSEDQVDRWLKLWQQRLQLQDWKVEVRLVRIWQLEPHTLGHIHWSRARRTATIKVLDPVDYNLPRSRIADDIELSVVHELIHLQLSSLTMDDKASTAVEEQVVNRLANTLVDLERRPATLASSIWPADGR